MNYQPLYRTIFNNEKFELVRDKHGNDGLVVWLFYCGQVLERLELGKYDFKLNVRPSIAAINCLITVEQLQQITQSLIEVKLVQVCDGELHILQLAKYLTSAAVTQRKRGEFDAKRKAAISLYSRVKTSGQKIDRKVDQFLASETEPLAITSVMTNHDSVMTNHDKKKERKKDKDKDKERYIRAKTLDEFPLPDEWRNSAKTYWAKKNRSDLDPDEEFIKFQDNHIAKGSKSKDWSRNWRTWYTNAVQFTKPQAKTSGFDLSCQNYESGKL